VSRFQPAPHQVHRLPSLTMWGITLLTAVGMAILNLVSVFAMEFLIKSKFHLLAVTVERVGVLAGVGVLAITCMGFSGACMAVIFCFAPDCGGSGSPENKGWLNGHDLKGYFTWRNFFGRAVATILSNATGYPVGREGPTVTMGSNLAYLITEALAKRHVKQWVHVDRAAASDRAAKIVDQERLSVARRVACAVGGMCGMAMIFNSPVGGFLYMFEDMTAASWPLELTFRSFVGLMVCSVLSMALLNLCGTSIREFVIYLWSPQETTWLWRDVLPVILLAALMGLFAAFHTRACLSVQAARQKAHRRLPQPFAKICEAVLFAGFVALSVALASLTAECAGHEASQQEMYVSMVRYNCPEDMYNPTASLLLTTAEGAVKRLFSTLNTRGIQYTGNIVAFFVYTIMNILLTGIPVPSGNFTGTMLIGAMFGRLVGDFLLLFDAGFAPPGIYSMAGAAAMLCSFKQMTFAVAVFITCTGNNFSMLPMLMLSVTVSLACNRLVAARGYDEEQVLRKKIPFLEPEMPSCMDGVCAEELCDDLPEKAVLSDKASVAAVRDALEDQSLAEFPVVAAISARVSRCVGFTPRDRLEAALRARAPRAGSAGFATAEEDLEEDRSIDVARLANPLPFMIPRTAYAARFYALFGQAGVKTACVVDEDGAFYGMITRSGLIQATHALEEAMVTDRKEAGADGSSTDEDENSDQNEAELCSNSSESAGEQDSFAR